MKGAKGSADEGVYESLFRPLAWKFSSGKAVERISAHIDLLPTLAHIGGLTSCRGPS